MSSNPETVPQLDPLVTRALDSIDAEVRKFKDALIAAHLNVKLYEQRRDVKNWQPVRTARCEHCQRVFAAAVGGDPAEDGQTVGHYIDHHECGGAEQFEDDTEIHF